METVLSFFFSFEKIICSENQCKSKMFFQKRNWVPRNCSNSFVFGVESSYFEMLQVWSWNARIWDVSLYIFVYGGPHHPFDGGNIRPVWIQNKNNILKWPPMEAAFSRDPVTYLSWSQKSVHRHGPRRVYTDITVANSIWTLQDSRWSFFVNPVHA